MDNTEYKLRIKRAKVAEKQAKIVELCTSKTVLDVGCVGQDINYSNPNWLHNQIKRVCTGIDGVDIDSEGVNALREKGLSVFLLDELLSLNKKYDIVMMADVIEHVNDPVAFLSFYSALLNENGKMIITTPNAHAVRNFTSIFLWNNYSLNAEHTMWLCPKTMLEISRRAGLKFSDFWWLNEYFKISDLKGFRNRTAFRINSVFQRLRTNFYPNFMFIVSK